ncbi:primosomal protein N' [Nocardioides panacisoli]|uniref:primosomal protein N' n=1 Tax=Nocardioides panacisoli TaxID=627624 RepID=UPI001C630BE4|nr:primosomal protein N' [Nocardioides panacisoli]QYJ05184.1 primosomal protein N' [Nocardioides panacisoli]
MADDEHLELPGLVRDKVREGQAKARATRARKDANAEIAATAPVARVSVDVPLAHLDRTFDYAVPASMAEAAQPGVRVKVRFAGKDVDGFVVGRSETSDHDGRLAPLRRVVSAEQVLTPQVRDLCRSVADHCAGVAADVRRLAVPPRHATVEKQDSPPAAPLPTVPDPVATDAPWAAYPEAEAFVHHLRAGGAPRAVWGAAPGEDWPRRLAELAATALDAGRGSLLCVPDNRDVDRLDAALRAVVGEDQHVVLRADVGPGPRYRDFLAVLRGTRRIVIGTRSAAFAPVQDLGLVAIWDDGDDLHVEHRAPYPHTRDVLVLRSREEGAAALIGGFARSVEAQQLLGTGWAREIALPRDRVRERALIAISGASEFALRRDPDSPAARFPLEARDAIRWGLERGPVLVQTPRAGYALRLACDRCRTPARCATCAGPLQLQGPTDPPQCRWCAAEAPGWTCGECGGRGLRAPVLGDARTADELGRTFPSVPVVTSSGDRIRASVPSRPQIVVATPGAEPPAADGYAVVVLLDTWLLVGRDSLRAGEEALRRWCNAVGLLAPGGRALAVGEPGLPVLQALVRWDPAGFAAREAADRAEARMPPGARLATVTGEPGAVDDAVTLLGLPEGGEVLGPLPLPDTDPPEDRVVVRTPRQHGAALTRALQEMQRVRSARKLDAVRVRMDPVEV